MQTGNQKNQISLLNYDIKKKSFALSIIDLGDMITEMREIKWDYDENDEFLLKNMKSVDAFIPKNQNKKNIKINEDAELIRAIYKIIPNPKENEFKNNLQFEEPKTLKIDNYCLISIGNIIMHMLECIIHEEKDYPKFLNDICCQNDFSKVIDIKLWEKSLIQFKNEFNQIETLSFNLSNTHDKIDIGYLILFYYFYHAFFPKVKRVFLNLNVNRINNIYNIDKNPYKIREGDIKDFSKKFETVFLANFIITSLIGNSTEITDITITMSESYITENNSIFDKEFEKSSFKEMITKKLSLLFFRKILMLKNLKKISITINPLDTFLFNEIIILIANNSNISTLELQLFSEPKYFNLRKLYLNYLNGEDFSEIDPNISEKYKIIMYPYIENLEDGIMPLIEEEKIPDLLFPEFKKNINKLKNILYQYARNLKTFRLDITPYEELLKYDNYNIEIILFIFIILSTFENPNFITNLELKCLNISYTSVIQITKKIYALPNNKLTNLSNCKELERISINIPGISLFLDFNNLPWNNLKIIDIAISTLRDMEALNNALKNQKDNSYVKLSKIKLCICLNVCSGLFDEFLKIYENLPLNLEELEVKIENIIGKNELLKILKAFHKNKNGKNIIYNLHSNSKELEGYCDENKIIVLKQFLKGNNVDFIGKCKYNVGKLTKMSFGIIKWPELNILKSIILSLNRKMNTIEDKLKYNNKKIFSNIFNFMGKSQDFLIVLD